MLLITVATIALPLQPAFALQLARRTSAARRRRRRRGRAGRRRSRGRRRRRTPRPCGSRARRRSARAAPGCVDPQSRLMLRPSGSSPMHDGLEAEAARTAAGATVVVAPFAQSIASVKPRERRGFGKHRAQVIEIRRRRDPRAAPPPASPSGAVHDGSATIASTSRSTRSVNFSPRPENTLMPLSSNGLCDAEITTPASKPGARVR